MVPFFIILPITLLKMPIDKLTNTGDIVKSQDTGLSPTPGATPCATEKSIGSSNYIGLGEWADRVGCPRCSAYYLARAGLIPIRVVGGHYQIREDVARPPKRIGGPKVKETPKTKEAN